VRYPFLALLCLVIVRPAVAADPADPFPGTWRDDRLAVTLAKQAQGNAGYSGAVTLGARTFPLIAAANGRGLTGNFTDGPHTFLFTAELDKDTLVFKTGKAAYRLARATAAANPLENPAVAKPDPASAPPSGNPPPDYVPGPDPKRVEQAITRAKSCLYSAQANGNWDLPQRGPDARPDARGNMSLTAIQNSSQWGGLTALCTYALLAAGDSPVDARLAAPIAFLKQADVNGTYALGCRGLVWAALGRRDKDAKEMAKRDRDLILKNQRTDDRCKPFFRYLADNLGDTGSDHSASQFAVLGLWAAEQAGAEMPLSWWKETEAAWMKDQATEGGWSYSNTFSRPMPATPSMTAAGVATLFICQDQILAAGAAAECRGNVNNPAIDKGIRWLVDRGQPAFRLEAEFPYYTLYGMERIGLASGYKYLGTVDWYKQGAAALLDAQNADGSFGTSVSDTCFALLFLARGRAPVVMNKLQFEIDTHGDAPRLANWNQRPRDAASLTRWLSRQLEVELNWQIVNLAGPVEDLHDAPILYLAGNQALSFTPEQEAKLRRFVHQGGLILGNADCADSRFAASFAKLGSKLFPPYEFRDLPPAHLLYTSPYPRTTWKNPPRVQGLSNGARELMILIPSGDPARFWQTGAYRGHEASFEFLANLFLYCNERQSLRHKGDSPIVVANPRQAATRSLKVARLLHDYNPDPEPGGWPRLAAILHNENQLDLALDAVRLGEGKLQQGGYKLAHLTATGKVTFKPEQRAELKAFVDAGGTLLVDATAGDPDAASSLESEVSQISGGQKLEPLPLNDPLYANLGIPAEQITYRRFATQRTLGNTKGPRLRAITLKNRPAILFSPEDLSVGLVGQPVDGIMGYTPASATAIVRAVVLSTAAGTP
jgi:hypothetical protein